MLPAAPPVRRRDGSERLARMSPRRTRRGDADAVAEQGLGLGLELGEVEVGAALLQGDHELSGIGAEFDSGDPVPGCKLGQKAGRFSEQSIIGAGPVHTIESTLSARRGSCF